MSSKINKSRGPGVYIPPPLLYVLIFILAIFIQKKVTISDTLFHTTAVKIVGVIFLIVALFFPLLLIVIQEYIIKREEKYLEIEFGQEYNVYKQKVKRWL